MTPPIDACHVRVNLLGRPSVDGHCGGYRMRGRKSWALLAYLVLAERPPTRSRLAGLLFEEADDPLAALRWSLAEIRRGLRGVATLEGDPVVLGRVPELVVDVDVVSDGPWTSAVRLPGLGSDLLEGMTLRGAPVFESWLLAEQRRIAAATAAHLESAGQATAARGDYRAAIAYAVRRVTLSPLDDAAHADLVRLYRAVGDHTAAAQHQDAYARVLGDESAA
jgi:DNA-binding SARP family transcriptional activator